MTGGFFFCHGNLFTSQKLYQYCVPISQLMFHFVTAGNDEKGGRTNESDLRSVILVRYFTQLLHLIGNPKKKLLALVGPAPPGKH